METEFAKHAVCPKVEDIAEVWKPFSDQMDLYEAWRIYHDSQQETQTNVSIAEMECPDIVHICSKYGRNICVYQGIVAGDLAEYCPPDEGGVAVFLMEGTWKPMVNISRSKVSDLPLITLLVINGILGKYQMLDGLGISWGRLGGWKNRTLTEWKKMKDSQLNRWMRKNQESLFTETMQKLQKPCEDFGIEDFSLYGYSDYAV